MKNPNDGKLKPLIQLHKSLASLLSLIQGQHLDYRNRDIASRYNFCRKEIRKLMDDANIKRMIPPPVWVLKPLLHIPIALIIFGTILATIYPFTGLNWVEYLLSVGIGLMFLFVLLVAFGVIDRYEGNHMFLASSIEQVGYRTILLIQSLQEYITDNYPPHSYSIRQTETDIDNKLSILENANKELEQKLQQKTKELSKLTPINPDAFFVSPHRLKELHTVRSEKFDLAKLIKLCEEANECYSRGHYLSVALITRAILDHVPPIFDCKNFAEVANNYSGSGRSFKQSMQHLQNSSRKIADAHLHTQIREKETLPNQTQVNFSNDLDVLFAEIVRTLK